jgi:predicted N-acetyltransferase YhbS
VQIGYLADHPEHVPALAALMLEEWRALTPGLTLARREAMLREQLNRDTLPIAWVAHEGGRPLGTAALRARDVAERPELGPWLGAVYVVPDGRGRGIGAALCAAVEERARALGHETLYLATVGMEAWYLSLGWEVWEEHRWGDLVGTIMRKRLLP